MKERWSASNKKIVIAVIAACLLFVVMLVVIAKNTQTSTDTSSLADPRVPLTAKQQEQTFSTSKKTISSDLAYQYNDKVKVKTSELKQWTPVFSRIVGAKNAQQSALGFLIFRTWREEEFKSKQAINADIAKAMMHFGAPANEIQRTVTSYSLILPIGNIVDTVQPTEADIKVIYRRQARAAVHPQAWDAQVLAFNNKKEAANILRKLQKGVAWQKAVRNARSAREDLSLRGGERFIEYNARIPSAAVLNASSSAWSIHTSSLDKPRVYYITRIAKRYPARKAPPYKKVRAEIIQRLSTARAVAQSSTAETSVLANLRSKTLCGKVRINLCANGPRFFSDITQFNEQYPQFNETSIIEMSHSLPR